MSFPGRDPWRAETDGIFSEALRPPTPILQQLGRQLRDFFRHALARAAARRPQLPATELERLATRSSTAKRLLGIARASRHSHDDLPFGSGKASSSRAPHGAVQAISGSLGGRTGTAGRLDAATLNDQERAFFLQPSDGLADIRVVEPFLGLEILDGQPLCRFLLHREQQINLVRSASVCQDTLSDSRHRDDGSDDFRIDCEQRLGQ